MLIARLVPFLLFILFMGCRPYTLHVHTEYVGCQNLASYHVGTPDPALNNPPIGQRLMINWKIPSAYVNNPTVELIAIVRFCNREEKTLSVPLNKASGLFIYTVLNEYYYATGGIRAYKVELKKCGLVHKRWSHHLWKDLINISDEEDESS